MSKEAALQAATGTPEVTTPPPAVPTESVIMSVDSDRFAKIAAREAKLVKEREAFKSEQQLIYEEKKKLADIKTQIDEFEAMKKADPIAALKKLGFSETDIFNFMANKEEPTPEQVAKQEAAQLVQEEIKKLRDEQAQKEAQALKERDDRAIESFKENIGKSIAKESEKYEFCSFKGAEAEGIVYETILEIIKEDPEVLPHKALQEALELTEKFYEEEALEMTKLKKIQPKPVEPVVEASKKPARVRTPEAQKVTPKPVPTLTSKVTATTASTVPKAETKEQKRARLESWLKNGKPM